MKMKLNEPPAGFRAGNFVRIHQCILRHHKPLALLGFITNEQGQILSGRKLVPLQSIVERYERQLQEVRSKGGI
jgi:hypothetical protein